MGNIPFGEKKYHKCMCCHYHSETQNLESLPLATYQMKTIDKNKYKNKYCICKNTTEKIEGTNIEYYKDCDECSQNRKKWLNKSKKRYDKIRGTILEEFIDWEQERRYDWETNYFFSCDKCIHKLDKLKDYFEYNPKGFTYYLK